MRFSITQHMSDQQHWWAHQTKKRLRLAPPTPRPRAVICWRAPSLPAPASLIWTLFQTIIYPEKARWAQFPLFHHRPHWYSYVSLYSHLGAARRRRRLVLQQHAALLERTSALLFFFISAQCWCFPVFPDLPSWSVVFPSERLLLRFCLNPFSTLCLCFCLTANPLLSHLTLLKQSEKLSCSSHEWVGQQWVSISVEQRSYKLWEQINLALNEMLPLKGDMSFYLIWTLLYTYGGRTELEIPPSIVLFVSCASSFSSCCWLVFFLFMAARLLSHQRSELDTSQQLI